ncbi:hypothetical protein GQ53DRAFT_878427, partial [Thozetella sp. PMI_491]
MHWHSITNTGLSVIYEPTDCFPIVDIVFVHGLQGHPYKTWASEITPKQPPSRQAPTLTVPPGDQGANRKKLVQQIVPKKLKAGKEDTGTELDHSARDDGHVDTAEGVYWPGDLLPTECPRARILSFGYDTRVTRYMAAATNRNSVYAHGKDFLFALSRRREQGRPLILIAHSLGGIIVKEMLTASSLSMDDNHKDIIGSTTAIIFLGTPHRGSPDFAKFGDNIRRFIGMLRVGTTSTMLDALGLKNTDLERTQDAFSRLWHQYDFRVKTFQEGLAMTGVDIGVFGKKVVPDSSSLLGDFRERAETLQSNHRDMCRYIGADDPSYRKVAGEIRSIYNGLHQSSLKVSRTLTAQKITQSTVAEIHDELSDVEKSALASLPFPAMNKRRQTLELPARETCGWLFETQSFQDWSRGQRRDTHRGMLWLKGKPGSGKSTLMGEAFRRASEDQTRRQDFLLAGFFFNARGEELEHSPTGLFRSILFQLLRRHRIGLQVFTRTFQEKLLEQQDGSASVFWEEEELKIIFKTIFTERSTPRILIFIDGLDECDSKSVRGQAYFWRDVTKASETDLNVCLSSRHFPSITVTGCPEIIVEDFNSPDIAKFVDQKFDSVVLGSRGEIGEAHWEILKTKIFAMSSGVFLWAKLVIDLTFASWDSGKGPKFLLRQINQVPPTLEALFLQLLQSPEQSSEETDMTLRLFQWAVLAVEPLRLYEWHHILAFIQSSPPQSLRDWRSSDYSTDSDEQLEKRIREISKGLVEIRTFPEEALDENEKISIRGRAGSFDLGQGETRVVQVIHESVRAFFLQGDGFLVLNPTWHSRSSAVGEGHLSIMACCLNYLNISELDALVTAR